MADSTNLSTRNLSTNIATNINDPSTLPLASANAALSRVVGVQTDQNGNPSYSLYPLKVLGNAGDQIVRLTFTPNSSPVNGQPPNGQPLQGVLTVWTADGNSYSVPLTLPAGAKGDPGAVLSALTATQTPANPGAGQSSTLTLGGISNDGTPIFPTNAITLPPGAQGVQGEQGREGVGIKSITVKVI